MSNARTNVKLQITVMPETRNILNQRAKDTGIPINRLIATADAFTMGLLLQDLNTRLEHNTNRYN